MICSRPRRDDVETRRYRLRWLEADRRLVERTLGFDDATRRYFDRHVRAIRAGYPFGGIPAPWEDIVLEFEDAR
jgi:hypothetical protein